LQQIDILGASPNWLGRPYWLIILAIGYRVPHATGRYKRPIAELGS
jgi:hypothetical protein